MPRSSPFEAVHRQLGANFNEYNGWLLPADYGSRDAESEALKSHCAVVDLTPFGRLQVSGDSVKNVLESVFQLQIQGLLSDQWSWAKTTFNNQEIVCRLARSNGQYFLLTRPEQTDLVRDTIDSIKDKAISVSDVTEQTAMLGLYGPAAYSSLRGVLPFDIDYLDPGDVEKVSFLMLSFTLLRGSWLNGEGIELICPAAAGPIVAGTIAKYRHKYNLTPAGMNSLMTALEQNQPPM